MQQIFAGTARTDLLEAIRSKCESHALACVGLNESFAGQSRPTAVLDLTADGHTLESVSEFLGRLAEARRPARLVVLEDGTLPAALVETVDLFRPTYVSLDGFSASELVASLTEPPTGVAFPESRRVESAGVCFRTYEHRLFDVYEQVRRIAVHDVTLLIVGETGTGKSTLARLIHDCSPRCEGPFRTVACGTLPPDIIESELFGHVRGAFTGADRRKEGRFASAAGGTLLLDEIDVLGNKQQAMLLRVIETGEYEPVGSSETVQSNARLIVAANVELEKLAETDEFRADLYYRLNVLEVRLPPLRERTIDLIPLTMQFVRETGRERGIAIDRVEIELLDLVRRYPWPGNLRELKNHVQRAVLFSEDGLVSTDGLSPKILNWTESRAPATDCLAEQVADAERTLVEQALRKNGFKRVATAKALGISRVGLYKKMKRLGLLDTTPSSR